MRIRPEALILVHVNDCRRQTCYVNCIYRGEEFYSAIDFVREYSQRQIRFDVDYSFDYGIGIRTDLVRNRPLFIEESQWIRN